MPKCSKGRGCRKHQVQEGTAAEWSQLVLGPGITTARNPRRLLSTTVQLFWEGPWNQLLSKLKGWKTQCEIPTSVKSWEIRHRCQLVQVFRLKQYDLHAANMRNAYNYWVLYSCVCVFRTKHNGQAGNCAQKPRCRHIPELLQALHCSFERQPIKILRLWVASLAQQITLTDKAMHSSP